MKKEYSVSISLDEAKQKIKSVIRLMDYTVQETAFSIDAIKNDKVIMSFSFFQEETLYIFVEYTNAKDIILFQNITKYIPQSQEKQSFAKPANPTKEPAE